MSRNKMCGGDTMLSNLKIAALCIMGVLLIQTSHCRDGSQRM